MTQHSNSQHPEQSPGGTADTDTPASTPAEQPVKPSSGDQTAAAGSPDGSSGEGGTHGRAADNEDDGHS